METLISELNDLQTLTGCAMKYSKEKNIKGFSLIELMVAVAIVAIIAVVAIPSYQSHLVKGSRAAAQSFMLDVENREKQFLLDARSYTNSLTTLGMAAPADVSRYYTISIVVVATPPSFTITAEPIAGTRQASDGNLTLTSAGAKTHGASNTW